MCSESAEMLILRCVLARAVSGGVCVVPHHAATAGLRSAVRCYSRRAECRGFKRVRGAGMQSGKDSRGRSVPLRQSFARPYTVLFNKCVRSRGASDAPPCFLAGEMIVNAHVVEVGSVGKTFHPRSFTPARNVVEGMRVLSAGAVGMRVSN